MRVLRFRSAIPLFDQVQDHSSVSTKACKADARSGGPARPKGRREAALPWTGASTPALLHFFERSLCAAVPLFVALTVSNAAAVAETRPAELTASYRTGNSFADFVEAASRRFGMPVRWILAVIDVESAGDMRAKSPKGAMGLMQIMPETWAELRGTTSATILTIPMTTYLQVRRTCANCATVTVRRAYLQPTTRGLLVTMSVSPAAHCQ